MQTIQLVKSVPAGRNAMGFGKRLVGGGATERRNSEARKMMFDAMYTGALRGEVPQSRGVLTALRDNLQPMGQKATARETVSRQGQPTASCTRAIVVPAHDSH